MATNYANPEEASKKIEEVFANTSAANTDAAAQTAALNKATEESYKQRQLEGQQAQSQFEKNTMTNQMTALDAIRKGNASAIANGANAGLSAANQLSAILGLQDTSSTEATQLANDAMAAATERNTAMSQNAVTGQTQANQINQANLDRELGITSLFPQMGAAQAEADKATATIKAAELGLDASKYTADTQTLISKMQVDADWDKTLLSSSLEEWDRLQKEKSTYKGEQLTTAALQQNLLSMYLMTGDKRYRDMYASTLETDPTKISAATEDESTDKHPDDKWKHPDDK